MFDKKKEKKENSPPKKSDIDEDELLIQKEKQEALERLKNAPPGPVMCNCIKQQLDPTDKNKPCDYCGGKIGRN